MNKYFFTGGIMPGNDLMLYFNGDLPVKKHWVYLHLFYMACAEFWNFNDGNE